MAPLNFFCITCRHRVGSSTRFFSSLSFLLERAHVVTERHLIEQLLPWLTYCLHHVAAIVLEVMQTAQGQLISVRWS